MEPERHIRELQFDRPSSSRVGNDEHLLAVRIFKRNVLQVSGPALGVKPASAATDDA